MKTKKLNFVVGEGGCEIRENTKEEYQYILAKDIVDSISNEVEGFGANEVIDFCKDIVDILDDNDVDNTQDLLIYILKKFKPQVEDKITRHIIEALLGTLQDINFY